MSMTKQQHIKLYGSKEAFSSIMAERGALGGSAKVPKGFSMMDKEKLSRVARKGLHIRFSKKTSVK